MSPSGLINKFQANSRFDVPKSKMMPEILNMDNLQSNELTTAWYQIEQSEPLNLSQNRNIHSYQSFDCPEYVIIKNVNTMASTDEDVIVISDSENDDNVERMKKFQTKQQILIQQQNNNHKKMNMNQIVIPRRNPARQARNCRSYKYFCDEDNDENYFNVKCEKDEGNEFVRKSTLDNDEWNLNPKKFKQNRKTKHLTINKIKLLNEENIKKESIKQLEPLVTSTFDLIKCHINDIHEYNKIIENKRINTEELSGENTVKKQENVDVAIEMLKRQTILLKIVKGIGDFELLQSFVGLKQKTLQN